jgi:PiT family inorganic phosphate transporter
VNAIALLIILSLALAFMHGFHDSANSITTMVSAKILTPKFAVLFSTFFNTIALFIFQLTASPAPVGQGIVNVTFIDHYVLFGALTGALTWNTVAWIYNVSSSSSQALVGSIMGATMAKVGVNALISTGLFKIMLYLLISPTIGFILAGAIMWLFRRYLKHKSPRKVDFWFKKLQLISVACYGLAHGINDARKSISIICLLLISMGSLNKAETSAPNWVVYTCFISIGLGTLFGGWRVIKNMDQRLARLSSVNACSAEIALTAVFILGLPLSVSHTIRGAMLADSGKNYRIFLLKKGLKNTIVWSWVITFPVTMLISALAWYAGHLFLDQL